MMALAASDFLFCLVTISGTYLPETLVWHEKDFTYYHHLYGNFLQNTFIKLSTWFTVILAVSRYVVVSNPIRARRHMRCIHTVIAILTCTVVCVLLHIPLIYTWKVITIHCPVHMVYLVISGKFTMDKTLNSTFTYIWGLLGFILPIVILAYCNFKLINSLRLSTRLQNQSHKGQKSDSNNQKLITVTLVSIVCMYFVLVLPSELVFFYGEIAKSGFNNTKRMVHVTSNLLQAINFSMNFVLYCCANQYFRKVIGIWLLKIPLIKKLIHRSRLPHYRFNVNKSSSRSLRSSVTSKQTTLETQMIVADRSTMHLKNSVLHSQLD